MKSLQLSTVRYEQRTDPTELSFPSTVRMAQVKKNKQNWFLKYTNFYSNYLTNFILIMKELL